MAITNFDPYYHWLGIPPHEQPPHFYRLLGVQPFEPNVEVISNAADRQMAHVRTFQTGQRANESQQLLNEIARARTCLLDAQQRYHYDCHLSRLFHQAHHAQQSAVVAPLTAAEMYYPPTIIPTEPPSSPELVSERACHSGWTTNAENQAAPTSLYTQTVPPERILAPSPPLCQEPPVSDTICINVDSPHSSIRDAGEGNGPVRKRRKSPNMVWEVAKVIGGGAGGVVLAILILQYFFGVDVLGWEKSNKDLANNKRHPPELLDPTPPPRRAESRSPAPKQPRKKQLATSTPPQVPSLPPSVGVPQEVPHLPHAHNPAPRRTVIAGTTNVNKRLLVLRVQSFLANQWDAWKQAVNSLSSQLPSPMLPTAPKKIVIDGRTRHVLPLPLLASNMPETTELEISGVALPHEPKLMTEFVRLNRGTSIEVNAETSSRWCVVYKDSQNARDAIEIAEFEQVRESVFFRWNSSARDGAASQLRNCLLTLRTDNQEKVYALRESVVQPSLTLNLDMEKTIKPLHIPHPPRTENLYLELISCTGHFSSQVKDERRVKAAREPLIIHFPEIEPVWLEMTLTSGINGVAIGVEGKYGLNNRQMFTLSLPDIQKQRQELPREMARLNDVINNLQAEAQQADAGARDTTLSSGRRAILAAAYRSKMSSIQIHRDRRSAMDVLLDTLPRIEKAARAMNMRTEFRYKITAKNKDHSIVIAEN